MAGDVCSVSCQEDGPLLVKGELEVRGPGAEDVRRESKVALCCCGESGNKPFCDGSHREAEFRASGPIDTRRALPDNAAAEGGAVVITPHANGPYHFDGVIQLARAGDGEETPARFAKPWLCRCGASRNKPFCDGAHKEIPFEAEGL